jgi:hypothetical protein
MKLPILILAIAMSFTFGATAVWSEASGLSFESVSLERTACLGDCPVYQVSIRSDGDVKYVGIESVSQIGEQNSRIGAEELLRLNEELGKLHFFGLRSRTEGRWGCLRYKTDHPSITVRVVSHGQDKAVSLYTGCAETKDGIALAKFANLIDDVANTSRWIKKP